MTHASIGAPARCMQTGWFLLVWALALQRAHAHDFPTAFQALFQDSMPERLVVALRPGLALTEDGGDHWDFSCGEVMGLEGDVVATALGLGATSEFDAVLES